MGKTFIADTCDVTYTRKSDGHQIFTAEAQIASIAQAITEDIIRGGIGNKALYMVRHSKETTLSVTNALFDKEYLAMTQGVKVEEGAVTVTKAEKGLTVTEGVDGLEVQIPESAAGSTVTVVNAKGESEQATATGNTVTVPTGHAAPDEKVDVLYPVEVTGNVVEFAADKFSETYEVQYHTIEYDTETNQIVNDIYFIFDRVIPSGNFDMSFENGSPITPELSFNAMADTAGRIGRSVEVPRT